VAVVLSFHTSGLLHRADMPMVTVSSEERRVHNCVPVLL
jgi:hypothetical protein